MRRIWVLIALVVGGSCWYQHASAAILYRADARLNQGLAPAPGQAVLGMPNIRRVITRAELSHLSATERRTVQSEVTYHSLFTPSDPQYPLQWNLPLMNVAGAWDADTVPPVYGGDPNIVVAVLDTGVASTAVGAANSVLDFSAESVWKNTHEIPGDGIDNDVDGYIDDVAGWNFIANTNTPIDDNGHGTHIVTTIAGQMNNGVSTAGIASNVTIMPLKVLDQHGDGSTSTLTAAVRYAILHGANIINLSLGGDQDDPLFHQAIQQAVDRGIVVIGAAGNSGAGVVTFPASYAEVISVGAVQFDRTKAPYANYGARLDLVGPGGNEALDQNQDGQPDGILSSTCTDGSCTQFAPMFLVGTSQAAAQVSAVVALLESCGATPGNVRSLLTSTAQDLGTPGRDDTYGYGLIDAGAALAATGCVVTTPAPPSTLRAVAGAQAAQPLVNGRSYPYRRPSVTWSGAAGALYDVRVTYQGATLSSRRQTSTSTEVPVDKAGEYNVSVVTVDAVGRVSTSQQFLYRYQQPSIVLGSGSSVRYLSSALQSTRTLTTTLVRPAVHITSGQFANGQANRLLVTSVAASPTLTISDTNGKKLLALQPFGPTFRGAIGSTIVRTATGQGIIVAATRTLGATIAWYSSSGKKLGQNLVFSGDTQGIETAAGDLDGDGNDELVVAQHAGPEIRVYNFERKRIAVLTPRGKNFRQGWAVAVGDTDGDGLGEVLATPYAPTPKRKVLRLTVDGRERGAFTVTGWPATTRAVMQAQDSDGDGRAEVLLLTQQGTAILQRWSGTGVMLQKASFPSKSENSLSTL